MCESPLSTIENSGREKGNIGKRGINFIEKNTPLRMILKKEEELFGIYIGDFCALLDNRDPLRNSLSRAIGDRLYEIIIGGNIISDINETIEVSKTIEKSTRTENPKSIKNQLDILGKEIKPRVKNIVDQHGNRLQKLIGFSNEMELSDHKERITINEKEIEKLEK